MTKKRIVEHKLGIEPDIEKNDILPKQNTVLVNCNDLNLIDDYNIARDSVRTTLVTNTELIAILRKELELEPTNYRLAKILSELIINSNETANNLVELSKKMAEIYRLGREQDQSFAEKNVVFKDAILVGNLNDILNKNG